MTISRIKFFLTGKSAKSSSDFSAFFIDAKAREKKKVIEEVVRKANKDQMDLVRRAERGYAKVN